MGKTNVQITATVSQDDAAALENIFYDARGKYKRKNDVLREAVKSFIKKTVEEKLAVKKDAKINKEVSKK